ncbi:MAG: ROK family protein [Oligoflexia bacterium]|nr:ROK family protein [Oligoflexia bacterium]
MAQKVPQRFLAYDLGGTKVAVGIVTASGKVLEEVREPVVIEKGKAAVVRQLAELGQGLLKRHRGIRRVGMASAGPLDPATGMLLDPTNFTSIQGSWGKTPIARLLGAKLRLPVTLENDAAAAILAEHWVGAARGYDNAMILTLGTGLGTGILCNGELLRAGQGLHPEAGHLILRAGDESAPCGCGNLGCAEAFLSGRNFARRVRPRFADPTLTAKDIAELARGGDPRALAAFDEYSSIMATAIHNYAVIYAPEMVVLTGSFAAASDLFLKSTRERLKALLARRRVGVDLLPKLVISKLDNQAGLIGGAFVARQAALRGEPKDSRDVKAGNSRRVR